MEREGCEGEVEKKIMEDWHNQEEKRIFKVIDFGGKKW